MSESAVAAAVAVAAEYGLCADDPVVLSDSWHVLVHLRPLPLVARVSSGRPYPDGPPEEDVIRELAVASHAARAGAPVVPPSDLLPAGPHRRGGHVIAFWQYVEPSGEVDPAAAGLGLRAVHEALADYPVELLERDHEPSRIALEAYGEHDAELLDACVPVYASWIYASLMMALPRRPELGPRLAEDLCRLRTAYA